MQGSNRSRTPIPARKHSSAAVVLAAGLTTRRVPIWPRYQIAKRCLASAFVVIAAGDSSPENPDQAVNGVTSSLALLHDLC